MNARRIGTELTHMADALANARVHTYSHSTVQDVIAALRRFSRELSTVGSTHVVCLCGSTRFMDAFHEANRLLSLRGVAVFTVEITTYDGATDPQRADPAQKARLDELHLRKIDLSHSILVLNVGDYVGESTMAELKYARATGKEVRWWEPSTYALPDETLLNAETMALPEGADGGLCLSPVNSDGTVPFMFYLSTAQESQLLTILEHRRSTNDASRA